jgi:hypothetical protein
MKPVTAIAGVLAAATAGALIVHNSHEQSAHIEQVQDQLQQLVQHMGKLERALANTPSRSEHSQTSASVVTEPVTQATAGKPATNAANDVARQEGIQAANTLVDQAIQSGQWGSADLAAFGAASHALSGDEQTAILARLAAAMNRGQVRFDPHQRHPSAVP